MDRINAHTVMCANNEIVDFEDVWGVAPGDPVRINAKQNFGDRKALKDNPVRFIIKFPIPQHTELSIKFHLQSGYADFFGVKHIYASYDPDVTLNDSGVIDSMTYGFRKLSGILEFFVNNTDEYPGEDRTKRKVINGQVVTVPDEDMPTWLDPSKEFVYIIVERETVGAVTRGNDPIAVTYFATNDIDGGGEVAFLNAPPVVSDPVQPSEEKVVMIGDDVVPAGFMTIDGRNGVIIWEDES